MEQWACCPGTGIEVVHGSLENKDALLSSLMMSASLGPDSRKGSDAVEFFINIHEVISCRALKRNLVRDILARCFKVTSVWRSSRLS